MSNHEVLLMLNLDDNITFYKTLGFDSSFAPSNLMEDNYRKFLVKRTGTNIYRVVLKIENLKEFFGKDYFKHYQNIVATFVGD